MIDHFLLGVPSLATAIPLFESLTGVRPVFGGRHPNRGTENALLSLGDGLYLELIAPQPEPDAFDDLVHRLLALTEPRLVWWAARTNDIAGLRDRLGEGELRPGARVTPEGARLEWTTLAPTLPRAPFFIEWSAGTVHPSMSAPRGCSLVSFAVDDPDAAALNALLRAGEVGVVAGEGRAELRLVIGTERGEVRFTS